MSNSQTTAGGQALSRALRAWRLVAGANSGVERRATRLYRARRRRLAVRHELIEGVDQYAGKRFLVLESPKPGPPTGIFMKGSCDLPSMFLVGPLVRAQLRGSLCIHWHGSGVFDARPDILLQSRTGISAKDVREVTNRGGFFKNLGLDYFRPRLFEPTFKVPELPGKGPFPKRLVVLSVNPALVRTAYRHRQRGFIIDPGGYWMNQSMDHLLSDLSVADWFNENFQSIGRMSVESFYCAFGEVIRLVKQETGAQVVVYNSLVVEPGNLRHNYQFVRNPATRRRRDFDLALRELASKLDFAVMDIDRILKRAGVSEQVDFAHFPTERMGPIAEEAYRILMELGII